MKTLVVMPTMRKAKSLGAFSKIASDSVDFLVISKEKLSQRPPRTEVILDETVFSKSWIFNRITKRNYGFLYGYKNGYDMIVSLDDDCFPVNRRYFEAHEDALKVRPLPFNPLVLIHNLPHNLVEYGPRGFPRGTNQKVLVVLNQGLWVGDVDLDASTLVELGSPDGKVPSVYKRNLRVTENVVLPPGQFTTVCGMNMSFSRPVTPIIYQMYMDPDGIGINRYEDIWAGIVIKKILDRLDLGISVGSPSISHRKVPRDINRDLTQERMGHEFNTRLWDSIGGLELHGKTMIDCYLEVSNWLGSVPLPGFAFLRKLGESMREWIEILDAPM